MKKSSSEIIIIALALVMFTISCEKEGTEVLSGYVYYANTTIPVSDVLLTIDKKTANSVSNGNYISSRWRILSCVNGLTIFHTGGISRYWFLLQQR